MRRDAMALVRKCQGCQFFSNQVHAPAAKMAPIESPIPFECWGLVGLCDQPSTRNQQLEVSARGGRLFHEVGRGGTSYDHLQGADRPIFLEEHYLPLRPTSRHNHQKWDPIHLQLDEGAVYPIPDPASQHLQGSSRVQQLD